MGEPAEPAKCRQQTFSGSGGILPQLNKGFCEIILFLLGQQLVAICDPLQRIRKNHAAAGKQQKLVEKARQSIQDLRLLLLLQFFVLRSQFD